MSQPLPLGNFPGVIHGQSHGPGEYDDLSGLYLALQNVIPSYIPFVAYIPGTISAFTSVGRFRVPVPCLLYSVGLAMDTPPTGQPAIVDIHRIVGATATSVFGAGSVNRPQVNAAANDGVALGANAAIGAFQPGDHLVYSIDQVGLTTGSNVAGKDLTITGLLIATG